MPSTYFRHAILPESRAGMQFQADLESKQSYLACSATVCIVSLLHLASLHSTHTMLLCLHTKDCGVYLLLCGRCFVLSRPRLSSPVSLS